MQKRKLSLILPFILFLIVAGIFWKGLSLHPEQVPSPLVNKSIPAFQLPTLSTQQLITNKDFIGHITLLNIWSSWCHACSDEHTFLMKLGKEHYLTLYGLNYKDNPADAKNWLDKNGNPYKVVAIDEKGRVAIDWGVYGTPETFIIDKNGVIRFKQIGPITPDIWNHRMKPLIEQLLQER